MPNGTYNYTIILPTGYTTKTLTATIKTTTPLIIIMVPVSSTSQPFNYWIIVIVVIVIMLAVMFVVMTWTKGKKKGVPKELQEPPKTGEEKK